MKVLFLTPRYLPHIGGVETHLSHLIEELDHDVTIITEKHEPNLPEKEKIGKAMVWRMPAGNKFVTWRWLAQHLFLLRQANVIHIHDVFYWFFPFRPFFFWKTCFVTFHGYEAPGSPTLKQIFWHQLAAMYCDGNICVGGFHQKWYGVKPDSVTYGGVTAPTKMKHEHKAIFVGRLAEDTAILQYLRALLITQIHLDVFGDGPLRSQAENFVKHHKLDVTFHGFVNGASEKCGEYDITFASQYLSILQSLASGTRVIAYADTEIKTDYLRLTPFAQWIDIAESVEEVAASVEKKQPVSEEASVWACAQTWPKLAHQYESLWSHHV